jgi:hypothetical protein
VVVVSVVVATDAVVVEAVGVTETVFVSSFFVGCSVELFSVLFNSPFACSIGHFSFSVSSPKVVSVRFGQVIFSGIATFGEPASEPHPKSNSNKK